MMTGKFKDLKQRIPFALLALSFLALMLYLASVPSLRLFFAVLAAIPITIALWEFYQLAKKKEYAPSITYALPLSFLYIISTAAALTALTQTLFFIAITSFFLAYFSSKEKSLENIAITTLGFIYIPLPLSCIIHIVYLSPENSGVLWCAYLFAVTKLTDTGAFFIGKSLGRKPLALNLSPSKSIEGAIGGTIAGTLVSYAFFHFQIVPISALQSIFLGVLLSTTAQLGDLAESLIKRDANVKDSNKIPGLGGVLDTFDSLIPTAPILYLFLGTIS